MSEMDSEKAEVENAGGDGNAVMDVHGFEVEMEKPEGEGGEKGVLGGSILMEVESGIGAFSDKGGLEGNVVEEFVANDGVEAKDCVGDVESGAVKEKGACETPLPKGSEDGKEVPGDSHMKDSERDEEDKTNNDTLGMEVSITDGPEKKVESSELTPKSSLAESILKEEVQNDGELVNVGETNKEFDSTKLLDGNGTPVHVNEKLLKTEPDVRTPSRSFIGDPNVDGYESGTEEEQMAFMHEIEVFFKERGMDFKPPKFYQEQLNLLKLWRWVIKLGGYEQVSSNKLWRQVGESFRPPKTCTTVSWSFRGFYEKALLEYEKHKSLSGDLPSIDASFTDSMSPVVQGALSQPTQPTQPPLIDMQGGLSQPSEIGRVRRDAAARAMQGWHSLRVSNNDELGDPIIKDRSLMVLGKREKQLNSLSLLKRPKQSPVDHVPKVGHFISPNSEYKTTVADIGPLSDWVKVNVQRTKDCFEVYVLVPGLSREEVRVQSDPAGRLVISGQPEHLDNPWGVTPFKKVVTLPSRIDPHQTSAVVTLHGQLFVRVPFEQSDS